MAKPYSTTLQLGQARSNVLSSNLAARACNLLGDRKPLRPSGGRHHVCISSPYNLFVPVRMLLVAVLGCLRCGNLVAADAEAVCHAHPTGQRPLPLPRGPSSLAWSRRYLCRRRHLGPSGEVFVVDVGLFASFCDVAKPAK